MKSVLSTAFSPAGRYGLGHRLVLHEDRIELRAFGLLRRAIPLSSVTHVFVATDSAQIPNFRLTLRGEPALEGQLEALLLWKYALLERLGAEIEAPPMPTFGSTKMPQAA